MIVLCCVCSIKMLKNGRKTFRKWNRCERLHSIMKTCQHTKTKKQLHWTCSCVVPPEGEMEALTMREKLKKLKELKQNSKGFLNVLTTCSCLSLHVVQYAPKKWCWHSEHFSDMRCTANQKASSKILRFLPKTQKASSEERLVHTHISFRNVV